MRDCCNPPRRKLRQLIVASRLVLAFLLALAPMARAEDPAFRIPPVKSSFTVENQSIEISASGLASRIGPDLFQLKLDADLGSLQENITALLRPQVDRSNRCGERISLERATLAPMAPSSLLTAYVHYEKWACAKAFGKEVAKRLVGGNGVIPVKLTPAVDQNTVRLNPEVGEIQADGSLGEMLRSGSFGADLRDKISEKLVSTIQKSTNLGTTLPPGLESVATLRSVRFAGNEGRLSLAIQGELRIQTEKIRALLDQMKSETTHTH
jgi:hypothetical protein